MNILFAGFTIVSITLIYFKNYRAVFWLFLCGFLFTFCSKSVQNTFEFLRNWQFDQGFLTLIAVALFAHLVEKFKLFEWEWMIYQLARVAIVLSAAKFLSIPVLSDYYNGLMIFLFWFGLSIIFANTLLKTEILPTNQLKTLNKVLKVLGCNSDKLMKKKGWAQRWY